MTRKESRKHALSERALRDLQEWIDADRREAAVRGERTGARVE